MTPQNPVTQYLNVTLTHRVP